MYPPNEKIFVENKKVFKGFKAQPLFLSFNIDGLFEKYLEIIQQLLSVIASYVE